MAQTTLDNTTGPRVLSHLKGYFCGANTATAYIGLSSFHR
jgi:hypothetical protein